MHLVFKAMFIFQIKCATFLQVKSFLQGPPFLFESNEQPIGVLLAGGRLLNKPEREALRLFRWSNPACATHELPLSPSSSVKVAKLQGWSPDGVELVARQQPLPRGAYRLDLQLDPNREQEPP